MAKFNLQTVLSGLVKVQQTLRLLEAYGIDVDRLIGISNAQGPQAKMIKAILLGAIEFDRIGEEELESLRTLSPIKEIKTPKKKPKKLSAKPS
jgi:hypothetical protein